MPKGKKLVYFSLFLLWGFVYQDFALACSISCGSGSYACCTEGFCSCNSNTAIIDCDAGGIGAVGCSSAGAESQVQTLQEFINYISQPSESESKRSLRNEIPIAVWTDEVPIWSRM